ncbi:MAG: fibronectin type III domain-containing protein [bacterium]
MKGSKLAVFFKVILIYISVVFLFVVLILIFLFVTEPNITLSNISISNVTDSSVTVTFLTKELSNPKVIVSEEDNFNIFNQFSLTSYQDDREIENRYTHHITITGLNPSSKYYYKISTGIKNIEINYPVLETAATLITLTTPNPSYGEFLSDTPNDSIVFFQNTNTQILSTVLNSNNAFSLDKSNLRSKSLEGFVVLNNEEELNFSLMNSTGTYTFLSYVGLDQPIDIELKNTKVVLNKSFSNIAYAQYSCGSVGSPCGIGGTCTPSGCLGSSVSSAECTSGSKCSGKTVQNCSSGKWVSGEVCDGTTRKCEDGRCVDIPTAPVITPVVSTYSCGSLGSTCGKGGVCTPGGCQGETISFECSNGQTKCNSKMIQDCKDGKWTNTYSCDGLTKKCVNSACVDIHPITGSDVKEIQSKSKIECEKLPDKGKLDSLCSKYFPESELNVPNETALTAKRTLTTEECAINGQTPMIYKCCSGLILDATTKVCLQKNVQNTVFVDSKVISVNPNDQNKVGTNACGQVSICTSLSGGLEAVYLKCIEDISTKGDLAYNQNQNGVNSEDLVNATKKIVSESSKDLVSRNLLSTSSEYLSSTLSELSKGNEVIAEVYGKYTENSWVPSSKESSSFFHYARVLGVDSSSGEKYVILENTISPNSSPIVKVKLEEFNLSLLDRNLVNGKSDLGIQYVQIVLDKVVTDKYVEEVLIPIRDNTSSKPTSLIDKKIVNVVNAEDSNSITVYSGKLQIDKTKNTSSDILSVSVNSNNLEGGGKVVVNSNNNQVIKFFNDLNGDGIKQDNEPFTIEPINVNVEKLTNVNKYDLKVGWNLINVSVQNDKIKTANDLLIEISRQGGYATHIATYQNGKWVVFSQRAGSKFGVDFNLSLQSGYFVKVYKEITFILEGKQIEKNTPIYISTGWNLLGIRTDKDKKASTLIEDMNKTEGIVVDTVTKYTDGRYSNLVKDTGTIYGQDFVIDPNLGYFIRASKGGKSVSSY